MMNPCIIAGNVQKVNQNVVNRLGYGMDPEKAKTK
jgi:hypothetical protein